jgi:hypothetical protein
MAVSSQTSTRVAPPFCDPDQPPARYSDYPLNFDMHDLPDHLAYWPLLRERLERCSKVLSSAYDVAERTALQHQEGHDWLTLLAAGFGTLAVLLAIIQLAAPGFGDIGNLNLTVFELSSALAAGAAVYMIFRTVKNRWQLGRHKAERLRQLKFAFLIDPETWCGDDALNRQVDKLSADAKNVVAMTSDQFQKWAAELDRPERPLEPRACPLDSDTLDQLVEYYRAKRLVFQKLYFDDRSKRNDARDWFTGPLAPWLFFLSVACILVHFFLDRFPEGSGIDKLGRWFIIGAVALPTFSAGIRFYCATHEFARNKVRYRAKEVGLTHLDEVLQRSSGADAKIRDIEFCEHALGLEHREWSRLMIETEVFP